MIDQTEYILTIAVCMVGLSAALLFGWHIQKVCEKMYIIKDPDEFSEWLKVRAIP